MKRYSPIALAVGLLMSFAVHAQDPQKPAPGPGQEPNPQIIESMMRCIAEGLPEGWQKTWFVISEIDRLADSDGATRRFEAKFFYATDPNERAGRQFKPCGANRIVDGVIALNDYLQPSQRRWTSVTMTFMLDGSYNATYDYTVDKPAPAAEPVKPAAKPAAKKPQETSK